MKAMLAPFKGSVKSYDALVGAGAGVVGNAIVQYAKSMIAEKAAVSIPAWLEPLIPVIGGALAGVGLYMVQKKSARGQAHLVGAVAAGAVLTLNKYAVKYLPAGARYAGYSDLAALVPTARIPYGLISPQQNVADVQRSAANLSGLHSFNAAYADPDPIGTGL